MLLLRPTGGSLWRDTPFLDRLVCYLRRSRLHQPLPSAVSNVWAHHKANTATTASHATGVSQEVMTVETNRSQQHANKSARVMRLKWHEVGGMRLAWLATV